MNRQEIDKQAMDFIKSGRAELYKEPYMAFTAFAEHILRSVQNSRWKPITDLSENVSTGLILLHAKMPQGIIEVFEGYRMPGDRFKMSYDRNLVFEPTSYMPLPSMPGRIE